jgi:hypothetical protein
MNLLVKKQVTYDQALAMVERMLAYAWKFVDRIADPCAAIRTIIAVAGYEKLGRMNCEGGEIGVGSGLLEMKRVFFVLVLAKLSGQFEKISDPNWLHVRKLLGDVHGSESIFDALLGTILTMLLAPGGEIKLGGGALAFCDCVLAKYKPLGDDDYGAIAKALPGHVSRIFDAVVTSFGNKISEQQKIFTLQRIFAFMSRLLPMDNYGSVFGAIQLLVKRIMVSKLLERSGTEASDGITQMLAMLSRFIAENFAHHPVKSVGLVLQMVVCIIGTGEKNAESRAVVFGALGSMFSEGGLKSLFNDVNWCQKPEISQRRIISPVLRLFLIFRVNDNYANEPAEKEEVNRHMPARAIGDGHRQNLQNEDMIRLGTGNYRAPVLTSEEAVSMFHFFASLVAAIEQYYPNWSHISELRDEMANVLIRLSVLFFSIDNGMKRRVVDVFGKIFAASKTLMYAANKQILMASVAGDSELSRKMYDMLWPESGKTSPK